MMREIGTAQKRIQDALIDLLAEKDFKKITITDIVSKAHVSRTTYYYHYYLQEEVVDEIINDFYLDLQTAFDKSCATDVPDYEGLFACCIKVFHDHNEAIAAILSSSISDRLEKSFFALWNRQGEQWRNSFQDFYAGIDVVDHLTESFVYSGIWGMLREWVLGGCAEPEEQVADLLKRNVLGLVSVLGS